MSKFFSKKSSKVMKIGLIYYIESFHDKKSHILVCRKFHEKITAHYLGLVDMVTRSRKTYWLIHSLHFCACVFGFVNTLSATLQLGMLGYALLRLLRIQLNNQCSEEFWKRSIVSRS